MKYGCRDAPPGPMSPTRHRPFFCASAARARNGRAHCADDLRVIGLAEDRRTGDEGVGACRRDLADVVRFDTTVDLEPDRPPALAFGGDVDHLAHAPQLV